MTKKTRIYLLWLLTILLGIGTWLTGDLGVEVNISSHIYGRHIGFDEKQTYDSLLGWFIVAGCAVGLFIIMYRSHRE